MPKREYDQLIRPEYWTPFNMRQGGNIVDRKEFSKAKSTIAPLI